MYESIPQWWMGFWTGGGIMLGLWLILMIGIAIGQESKND